MRALAQPGAQRKQSMRLNCWLKAWSAPRHQALHPLQPRQAALHIQHLCGCLKGDHNLCFHGCQGVVGVAAQRAALICTM